jgi:4-oxalocrotonate tautomerase
MPSLNLKIAGPAQAPAVRELVAHLVTLTTEVLGKKKEVIAVAVELVPAEHWFVGGRPLMPGRVAFQLEINVCEGTNTRDEKAAFVTGAHAVAEAALGAVDPVSYTLVHEVRADAYGYGGMTRERRDIEGRTRPAAQPARVRAI